MKLSEAQRRLLHEVYMRPQVVTYGYQPAQRLVLLGYVSCLDLGYGNSKLEITPAGRKALEDSNGN